MKVGEELELRVDSLAYGGTALRVKTASWSSFVAACRAMWFGRGHQGESAASQESNGRMLMTPSADRCRGRRAVLGTAAAAAPGTMRTSGSWRPRRRRWRTPRAAGGFTDPPSIRSSGGVALTLPQTSSSTVTATSPGRRRFPRRAAGTRCSRSTSDADTDLGNAIRDAVAVSTGRGREA